MNDRDQAAGRRTYGTASKSEVAVFVARNIRAG